MEIKLPYLYMVKTNINEPAARKYKCMAVVRPTLSSDKVGELVSSMLSGISEGESIEAQNVIMQVLAYPMDRNKQGHMVTLELNIKPATLLNIRRKMEIDENFLRVMFLKEVKIRGKNNFQMKDDFIKNMSIHTTKRGKISFNKNLNRMDKAFVSKSVKRLRFMGVLPYCNYDS